MAASSSRTFVLVTGSLLGGFLLSGRLCAQTQSSHESIYLRVPFAIDLGQSQLSSMLLELPYETVDLRFSELRKEKQTVRENTLSELFGALLAGDEAAMLSWVRSDGANSEDATAVTTALLTTLAQSGTTDLQLENEYFLSPERSIIGWRPLGVTVERNAYFHLEWDDGMRRLRWYPEGFPEPGAAVAALVVEAERAGLRGEASAVEFEPDAYRFSIPYGGLEAVLHFNGKSYRWNPSRESPPPGDVTEFYHRAYAALYEQGLDAFAENFTADSREQILGWYESFEDGQETLFMRDLRRQNRLVVFIIDADPFFVVCYNTFNAGPGYDTVVRDPVSGELRLTGFQMIGGIDLLLRDQEVFWKQVISPLASRGPEADTQPSMPTPPAFVQAEHSLASVAGTSLSSVSSAPPVPPKVAKNPTPEASAKPTTPSSNTPQRPFPWGWIASVIVVLGALSVFMKIRKDGHG